MKEIAGFLDRQFKPLVSRYQIRWILHSHDARLRERHGISQLHPWMNSLEQFSKEASQDSLHSPMDKK